MTSTSTNASSFLTLQEQQSLKDLDSQLIINVILSVVSLLTALSNLCVVLVIYNGGRSFRSHHYKLVSLMSCTACLEAFYIFIVMGVVRLIDTTFRIPANHSVTSCGLLLLVPEITAVVGPYTILVVSVDRLIAVICPFSYKNMSKTYKTGTIVFPLLAGTLDASAKFILWTNDFMLQNISICLMASTRTRVYSVYKNCRALIVAILTIFSYIVGIIVMKYRAKGNIDKLRKDLKFKLTTVSGTDAVIYIFTYFLGQIYTTTVVSNISLEHKIFLAPLVGTFNLLATIPRFLVNYYMNLEFRLIVKKCLFCKEYYKELNIRNISCDVISVKESAQI